MKDNDILPIPREISDIRSVPLIESILSRNDDSNMGRLNRRWAEAEAKRLGIKVNPTTQHTLPVSRFTRDQVIISARLAAVAASNH